MSTASIPAGRLLGMEETPDVSLLLRERRELLAQKGQLRAALECLTTLVYDWRKTGRQPDLHELSIACDTARSILAKSEGATP